MASDLIYDIPVRDIQIDGENVRQSDVDRDLQELAASIKRHGQLQPVVLRGEYGRPKYKLIIGQRRFRAIKNILNGATVKATFAGKLDDTQAAIRSLAENMCRTELSYADAAAAITALYKHFRHDDHRVAKETGLSVRKIRQFVDIEERASPKTKAKLKARKVQPVDVQRALRAATDDIDKADELLELMRKYDLDKHQKSRMVEYGAEHPRASAKEIIERAKEPIVEQSFVVRLSERARQGLLRAATKFAMAPDELAARAVEEWLSSQGFVS
jgi:ParB/RepB/Spo0J family partition protein